MVEEREVLLRIGVIGCGAIARRGHIPAYKSLPNIELCAVADNNEGLARTTAQRFGVAKYFKDYRQMLEDDSIDLVSVCTPSTTHADIAIDCAESGKNILMEKPLALDLKGALKIVDAANRNKIKLCVVHNFRYSPTAGRAKSRIDGGYLGRILTLQGTAHTHLPLAWTRTTWHYHEGGALDDFGPHLLDLILWFSGSRISKVSAFGGDLLMNMGCINNIQIIMEFENKTSAVADISWLGNTTVFDFHIKGTGGRIFADINQDHYLEIHGSQTPLDDFRSFYRKMFNVAKGSVSGALFRGGLAFHEPLIRDFVKSIEEETKIPVSGQEAVQTIAISEAAKLSLKENRVISVQDLIISICR